MGIESFRGQNKLINNFCKDEGAQVRNPAAGIFRSWTGFELIARKD
jgi:hypothetical protein